LINSSMSTRTKFGLGFGETFGSDEVFDPSIPSIFDTTPEEVEGKPLYDRFDKAVGMHIVPPPITGTFMPPSNRPDLDDTQFTYGTKSNNSFETNSVSNDFISCDNSDKSSDLETTSFASCVLSIKSSSSKTNEPLASAPSSVDFKTVSETPDHQLSSTNDDSSFSFKENVKFPRNLCNKSGINSRSLCKRKSFSSKTCFVCGSKFHLIKDCDFYEKQLELHNKPMWNNVCKYPSFLPKSSIRSCWYEEFRPTSCSLLVVGENSTSVPAGRTFSAGMEGRWGTAVKALSRLFLENLKAKYAMGIQEQWDISSIYMDNPYKNKDLGIVDSGCSRSMTSNKEKLDDFVKITGGTVTFGGGDRKITGKGTIKTSKLNFENVYYVEELQNFNLFLCITFGDTKNKVFSLIKSPLFSLRSSNYPENSQVSGKVPNISHLKPFGCLVTILNTSDHLGKFEGKADEGFLVRYAAHSKAYRVYNLSNKKIEEILNLRYLEDKPNVQGLGHEWYFDLDYLTDSLGYTRFKTNIHAGPKVPEASEMVENSSDYAEELARLQQQAFEANAIAEKHLSQADLAASRNWVPAGKLDSAAGVSDDTTATSTPVFKPVPTDATSLPGHSLGSSVHSTRYPSPSDLAISMSSSSEMEDIHHLPYTGIFSSSSYDDDFGGNVTNLAPSVIVDSVPTKRVNTIHHHSQILGDLTSSVQTRGTLKKSKFGASALLVPLPDGKITIGTKLILKNKRDARVIVVRNKARLVAQGHRQEEGIDYDEVFAPVARI
ncbi:putative ribonuclease H-like domain-containing protein, partial [Tanacetum coccineum]